MTVRYRVPVWIVDKRGGASSIMTSVYSTYTKQCGNPDFRNLCLSRNDVIPCGYVNSGPLSFLLYIFFLRSASATMLSVGGHHLSPCFFVSTVTRTPGFPVRCRHVVHAAWYYDTQPVVTLHTISNYCRCSVSTVSSTGRCWPFS